MSPTIESWNINPLDVGPIYPFVGWEIVMTAAGAAFCTLFMVWKLRTENAKYAAAAQRLRNSNELQAALKTNSTDQHQE
jgi:hypothetical protein